MSKIYGKVSRQPILYGWEKEEKMKGLNYAVAMLGVTICFTAGLILNAQLAYAEMDRQDLEQAVQREAEKLAKENPELAREFVREYKEYTRETPGYEHEKEIVAIKADQRGISDMKMAAGKTRIVEKPDIAAIHLNAVDKLAIRDDMRGFKETGTIRLSAVTENPHENEGNGHGEGGIGGGIKEVKETPVEVGKGDVGGGANTGGGATGGGVLEPTPKGPGKLGK